MVLVITSGVEDEILFGAPGWLRELSVQLLVSAQIMILRLMGSGPASGSVLTARSLEPASHSVSPSLCPSPAHALSLSLSGCDNRGVGRVVGT